MNRISYLFNSFFFSLLSLSLSLSHCMSLISILSSAFFFQGPIVRASREHVHRGMWEVRQVRTRLLPLLSLHRCPYFVFSLEVFLLLRFSFLFSHRTPLSCCLFIFCQHLNPACISNWPAVLFFLLYLSVLLFYTFYLLLFYLLEADLQWKLLELAFFKA